MSWNVIHLDQGTAAPWRNGGGATRELLAWPYAEDWRVRISVALIAGATQDFNRMLCGGSATVLRVIEIKPQTLAWRILGADGGLRVDAQDALWMEIRP